MINDGGDLIFVKLATLYTQCFKTSTVLVRWKNANMIFIHKKEYLKDLENLNPSRGTVMNHSHRVNQVMEKSACFNKPLCIVFIDYEKPLSFVEI